MSTTVALAQARPNIVLVIGDDLGWPHAGFMGDPIVQTPNLDTLAAEGTTFRQGFTTASVCLPSHRTLMAGVYSTRWNRKREALERVLGDLPLHEEVSHYRTLPRELARIGYRSFEGGKLEEGDFREAGFTDGMATQPPPTPFRIVGEEFGRDGIEPLRAFLDDVGTAPFFVWFAPTLPHVPFDAPEPLRRPYELMGRPSWEVEYYANVTWFDAVVGELLTELDRRGLRESTLLVYLSDNGWELGVDSPLAVGLHHGKRTAHELGNRTPIVLRWPGTIPAGVMRDDLVSSEDLLPTLLEFAGADPNPELGGRSLVDATRTGTPFPRDRVVTSTNRPAMLGGGVDYAVRTARWRYIGGTDGHEELYAIDTDPYETTDVAAEHPELLEGFRADVQTFLSQIDTPPNRLEVTGRLTDPSTGTPVPGATIRLRRGSSRLEALTDAGGWFALRGIPPGKCRIDRVQGAREVRWNGGPLQSFPLPLGSLGAYLPLTGIASETTPGPYDAEITGMVRDAAGSPLPAAVSVSGRVAGPRLRLTVLADAEGLYRVENLPPGTYHFRPRLRAYRSSRASVEITSGGTVALDLTMRASTKRSSR